MGKNSLIQWTDHTFNPWRGCMKVSEGCKNCYAEQLVTRRQGLQVWGQDAPRKIAAESTWREPLRWNKQAAQVGERRRVFCASLADVFEDYRGPSQAEISTARWRLWRLIEVTPALDWLLLTKRPQNVTGYVPPDWVQQQWPANVWVGCTVENQERATERLPWLLSIPAPVRFVSYEPALGPVDWTRLQVVAPRPPNGPGAYLNALTGHVAGPDDILPYHIDWLIVGGESGLGARPLDITWARTAVQQCKGAGVSVFVKQLGAHPVDGSSLPVDSAATPVMQEILDAYNHSLKERSLSRISDKKGGILEEWPEDLRVREVYPDLSSD